MKKLLILSFVLAACGGSDKLSAPATDLNSGGYAMVSVNGQPLPVTVASGVEVIEGLEALWRDGKTYTETILLRVTEDGVFHVMEYTETGTYAVAGARITFTPESGNGYSYVGAISTGTISYDNGTIVVVYRRR